MEVIIAIVSRLIDCLMAYHNSLNFTTSIVAWLIVIVLVFIDCRLVGCNHVLAYQNCLEAYRNRLKSLISMLLW